MVVFIQSQSWLRSYHQCIFDGDEVNVHYIHSQGVVESFDLVLILLGRTGFLVPNDNDGYSKVGHCLMAYLKLLAPFLVKDLTELNEPMISFDEFESPALGLWFENSLKIC